MTVTVAKATVIENVFKNFYDIINAISGIPSVYPAFHDHVLDASADYPLVLVHPPEIQWEKFTFGKGVVEGTIVIDVVATIPKDTDQYSSDVSNGIEVEKDTLAGVGLRQIQLETTSSDFAPHGDIKVFVRSMPFTFKFYYSKTQDF